MKRSIDACLNEDIIHSETEYKKLALTSDNDSPIYPSEYYKGIPELFIDHNEVESEIHDNVTIKSGYDPELSLNIPLTNQINLKESLVVHIVDSFDSSRKSSLSLSIEQVLNSCRESEYLNNLLQDHINHLSGNLQSPMSPMRAASPAALTIRGLESTSSKSVMNLNRMPSPKLKPINNINTNEGLVIFEENLNEALYLLSVISNLDQSSDLTSLSLKFNTLQAKIASKWRVQRLIDHFTHLMDIELEKILDLRSCNVVLMSGCSESVFKPHPRKPNSYFCRKRNKISTIDLIAVRNHTAIYYAWELTICLHNFQDKNTSTDTTFGNDNHSNICIRKMLFPCLSNNNTSILHCSGLWDGKYELKFRLDKRAMIYIKGFAKICDFVLSHNHYQYGNVIHGKNDIIRILRTHAELWDPIVFDTLFTKEEVGQFFTLK